MVTIETEDGRWVTLFQWSTEPTPEQRFAMRRFLKAITAFHYQALLGRAAVLRRLALRATYTFWSDCVAAGCGAEADTVRRAWDAVMVERFNVGESAAAGRVEVAL